MGKSRFLIIFFVLSLFLAATAGFAQSEGTALDRVYVLSDNAAIKMMLGVNHEFKGVFSTKGVKRAKALEALGMVETRPVHIYQATVLPSGNVDMGAVSTAASEYPWGIVRVGGGSGGSGIKVAVLDTGVDRDHPDLAANIVNCKAFGYRNCEDDNGHGTHVAGTILANGAIKGVAPEAGLIAVKVLSRTGSGYTDDIAAGIVYAVEKGANIISMSLGGDNPDNYYMGPAIADAVDAGVLVVAAAGNDGDALGSIDYPGAYANVVAVGATDSNDIVPYWSSRGDGVGTPISEKDVELGAPGVSVYSAYKGGGYATMSGTSMATPHVSGLAAKLWLGSADATRLYLRTITDDISPTGFDTATGYGLPVASGCGSGQIDCSGVCTLPVCGANIACGEDYTCQNPDTCSAECVYVPPLVCEVGQIDCSGVCTFPVCGDFTACAGDQTCQNPDTCSAECVSTPPVTEPACGDGYCAGISFGEDCRTCPLDCGSLFGRGVCCGDGKCDSKKGEICSIDCN